MYFTTATSVYQLEREGNSFVLTKIALLPGNKSRVFPGTKFRGDYVHLSPDGLKLFGNGQLVVKTSAITDL